MTQTDGPHLVLEQIQAFLKFHGIKSSLCVYPRPKNKPSKTLIITSSYCVEDFLENCLPFFIVKLPKARIALGLLNESNRIKKARDKSVEAAALEYAAGASRTEVLAKHNVGEKRLWTKVSALGIRKRKRWENGSVRNSRGQFEAPVVQ
jgi:hypothetical protein